MATDCGAITVNVCVITDPDKPPDILICNGAVLNQLCQRASGIYPHPPFSPSLLYQITAHGITAFHTRQE